MAKSLASIGDSVIYCREDYFGRIDEYPATIIAIDENNSADLAVEMPYANVHMPGIRYDPDGKPSSWHPKGK